MCTQLYAHPRAPLFSPVKPATVRVTGSPEPGERCPAVRQPLGPCDPRAPAWRWQCRPQLWCQQVSPSGAPVPAARTLGEVSQEDALGVTHWWWDRTNRETEPACGGRQTCTAVVRSPAGEVPELGDTCSRVRPPGDRKRHTVAGLGVRGEDAARRSCAWAAPPSQRALGPGRPCQLVAAGDVHPPRLSLPGSQAPIVLVPASEH